MKILWLKLRRWLVVGNGSATPIFNVLRHQSSRRLKETPVPLYPHYYSLTRKISVAHANFSPTLIGLFSAHYQARVGPTHEPIKFILSLLSYLSLSSLCCVGGEAIRFVNAFCVGLPFSPSLCLGFAPTPSLSTGLAI